TQVPLVTNKVTPARGSNVDGQDRATNRSATAPRTWRGDRSSITGCACNMDLPPQRTSWSTLGAGSGMSKRGRRTNSDLGPPSNGSRLSCGRPARRRKAVERQKQKLGGEATQFFTTWERTRLRALVRPLPRGRSRD